MSANNQLVLVRNPDGTCEIWYDGCVDNPFPISAAPWGDDQKYDSFEEAYKVAEERDDTEYGIRVIDGPVRELTEEEADALWADAEAGAEILLQQAIANGACEHCSSTYSAVWHGGSECERDPNSPKWIVFDAMRDQAEFNAVNIGYVARFVVETLSEHFTLTKKT